MAGVPYHYILRNLWVRKLTTLLTAGGMALVVFVFAAVLMLSEDLRPPWSIPAAGTTWSSSVAGRRPRSKAVSIGDRALPSVLLYPLNSNRVFGTAYSDEAEPTSPAPARSS
jgi:hypothetical protein